MLPVWCCIANRHIGARGTETADTTCALSGSISGAGTSIEIRLRMCGPPLHLTMAVDDEFWTMAVDDEFWISRNNNGGICEQ